MRFSRPSAHTFWRRLCLAALLIALGTAVGAPAFARKPPVHDRAKTSAKSMAEQAGKAYESGDFQRAALLYYNAWQTDDDASDYLFAAARAAHVGGLLDIAVRHYEEFLKIEGIDAARDKKARGYLDDIRDTKAAAKGQEAEKAQQTGDAALAAQLYQQAWQLAPTHHEYRFKSAVVLQTSGQSQQAEALLLAYLADAPADAVDRPEAQARLESLQKARQPAGVGPQKPAPKPTPVLVVPPPVYAPPVTDFEPGTVAPSPPKPVVVQPPQQQPTPRPVMVPQTPMPAPKPVVVQPKPQPVPIVATPQVKGPSRAAGWVLTVLGGVLLAASGSLAYTQYQDTQRYNNPSRDGSGYITSMTAADGNLLADAIDRNRAGAVVAGVLGATSLGLGIWQLVRTPTADAVAILPAPGGATLVGKF